MFGLRVLGFRVLGFEGLGFSSHLNQQGWPDVEGTLELPSRASPPCCCSGFRVSG